MNEVISKMLNVTPEIAKEMLANNTFERQRSLREEHINRLARAMTNCEFRQGTQISFVKFNDKKYLTNGQHTLNAIVKSGKPQILSVLETEVESEYELNKLYSTEDRHKSRNFKDVSKAYDLPNYMEIKPSLVNFIAPAIRFIDGDFFLGSYSQISDLEMIDIVKEYKDAAQHYFKFIAGSDKILHARLCRASSLSIGLITTKEAATVVGMQSVADFWVGVSLGTNEDEQDPRSILREHLYGTKMPSGYGRIDTNTKIVHQSYSSRFVAACWNAWINHAPFIEPNVSEQANPIFIAFTTYNQQSSEK